ncbi:MAG TPA: hypothetical protein VM618_00150, partial [Acidimicrobiia bacterium]|nr:hypothetical protein [Acidimicrobiia bacterium]
MPRRRALRRLTNASRIGRLAAAGLGLVAVTLAVVGVTAANTVAATRLDDTASTQGAQDVAPSACDGLALTVVVNGSTGGASNELVLGTSGIDVM